VAHFGPVPFSLGCFSSPHPVHSSLWRLYNTRFAGQVTRRMRLNSEFPVSSLWFPA
jgi:hypothetical protein